MSLGDKIREKLSKIWNWIESSEVVAKLTPKQEEEMINRIAGAVNNYGIEFPATLLFEAVRPVRRITSNLLLLPTVPLLELVGIHGYRYVSFFEKPDNIELLLKKIEEGTDEPIEEVSLEEDERDEPAEDRPAKKRPWWKFW